MAVLKRLKFAPRSEAFTAEQKSLLATTWQFAGHVSQVRNAGDYFTFDIAGQNLANPTAAILSAALMLDFLAENAAADRIRAACDDPVTGSTTDVGDVIAARVGN